MTGHGHDKNFAGYQLLTPLGEGSLSTVFKAVAPQGHPVVLKRLRPDRLADKDARLAFQMGQDLGAISGTIPTLDAGEFEGIPYRVRAWRSGPTLDAFMTYFRVSHEPIPLTIALFIAKELAQNIDHLHQDIPPRFHGNIKPNNILILPSGQVRLLDTVGGGAFLSYGDIRYAAPESVRGQVFRDGVDIYGVGAILFALLTLEAPHEQAMREPLLAAVGQGVDEGRLQLLRRLLVPDDVQGIIRQCLNIDPHARFHKMGELVSALRNAYQAHRVHLDLTAFFEKTCLALGFAPDEVEGDGDEEEAELATIMAPPVALSEVETENLRAFSKDESAGGRDSDPDDDDDDLEEMATIMAQQSPLAELDTAPLLVAKPPHLTAQGPESIEGRITTVMDRIIAPPKIDLSTLQTQETSRAAVQEALREAQNLLAREEDINAAKQPASAGKKIDKTDAEGAQESPQSLALGPTGDPLTMTLDLDDTQALDEILALEIPEEEDNPPSPEPHEKAPPAMVIANPPPAMAIANPPAPKRVDERAAPANVAAPTPAIALAPDSGAQMGLTLPQQATHAWSQRIYFILIALVSLAGLALVLTGDESTSDLESTKALKDTPCVGGQFWQHPDNLGRKWALKLHNGEILRAELTGFQGCELSLTLSDGAERLISPKELAEATALD